MIKLMIKNNVLYFLIATSFFLSGCNISPPNVSASIPLVTNEDSTKYSLLPSGIASELESAQLGQVIKYNNDSWIIGSNYTSALGHVCKQLEVNEVDGQTYDAAVCKAEHGWFLVPPLMSKAPSRLR